MSLGGDNIEYRPLRIGYSSTQSENRTQRRQDEVVKEWDSGAGSYLDRLLRNVNSYVGLNKRSTGDQLEEEVSLIALLYIKFYEDHKDHLAMSDETLHELNNLHDSIKKLGTIPAKVSTVIKNKFLTLFR